ncbi:MAG TPA: sugar phosphate isomerase/epimerase family protein [Acidobacteriota bacterium]|nr:sugar phosphate isomerase/epimerase family protein [Acidobacteriota bacterium]
MNGIYFLVVNEYVGAEDSDDPKFREEIMVNGRLSRRKLLAGACMLAGTPGLVKHGFSRTITRSGASSTEAQFSYCLNTATIRGQKLGIVKEAEIASRAGYDAIEPWVDSIDQYAKGGGSLRDLKKRIQDLGLSVESAIAFPEYLADDDAVRAKGFEKAKGAMDLVAQIGGKRIAAPPAGASDKPGLSLERAAERYRAMLELGDQMGVVPQLELWGFSQNLHRVSECAFVAIETGHPKACILPDVFHLYKGGSNAGSLRLLSAGALQVFHMNDYPSDPPRERINDTFRTYPGDGTAPLRQIVRSLIETGGSRVLSLELFGRKFWDQDALAVARTGLEKMRRVVSAARTSSQ